MIIPDRRVLRTRLLSKLVIDPSGCLIWTGPVNRDGYGCVDGGRGGRGEIRVHRAMWEIFEGPIPKGFEPDHLCHSNDEACPGGKTCPHRRCASIAHLEVVTKRENCLRGRSPAAVNARKTHCDNGHEYTPANTYIRPSAHRDCRTCIRERVARYKRGAA